MNRTGYLLTCKHAIPHIAAAGGGSVVNTISAAVYGGMETNVAYQATKAGVSALTRHIARKYDWCFCMAAARTRTPGTPLRSRWDARCSPSTCPATGTPTAVAATRPDLVRRAVLVDVIPNSGVRSRAMAPAERGAVALVSGPPVYESFEAMAAAAAASRPDRRRSAVERGVRHNARRLPNGRWTWRYDLFGDRPSAVGDHTGLWADLPAAAPHGPRRGRAGRRARDPERPAAAADPADRGFHLLASAPGR